MMISPLPGVDPSDLLRELTALRSDVGTLRAGMGGVDGSARRLWAYLEWADNSAHRLGAMTGTAAVANLVRTPAYELLLSNTVGLVQMIGNNPPERVLNTMLNNELTARYDGLGNAITELEKAKHWRGWAWLVVLDTNVYLEHENKLEDLDIAELVDAGDQPVNLLVPIAVIDELDRAKRGNNRFRAAYSLSHLIRAVDERGGVLRDANPAPGPDQQARGQVTAEIVLVPRGHRRLPDPDDEIADRALDIQLRSGAEVTMVTYDIGMSRRATDAGLAVVVLDRGPGPEPAPSSQVTGRRSRGTRSRPAM